MQNHLILQKVATKDRLFCATQQCSRRGKTVPIGDRFVSLKYLWMFDYRRSTPKAMAKSQGWH